MVESAFISAMLRLRKVSAQYVSASDITFMELITLRWIEDNTAGSDSNIYASELQDKLFISKAAVSQMLNAMEKRGYIQRSINEGNRRQLVITLTEEGRRALEEAKGIYAGTMQEIIQGFGEENLQEMVRLFDEFSVVVEHVLGEKASAQSTQPEQTQSQNKKEK